MLTNQRQKKKLESRFRPISYYCEFVPTKSTFRMKNKKKKEEEEKEACDDLFFFYF